MAIGSEINVAVNFSLTDMCSNTMSVCTITDYNNSVVECIYAM